jgi:hypothetical protein
LLGGETLPLANLAKLLQIMLDTMWSFPWTTLHGHVTSGDRGAALLWR